MASITQRFLVPVSKVSARNAWHNDPHLCLKYDEKPRREGGTLRKIGLGVRHACWNPYPISHQNLWFSLSYFRPEALEPGSWPERVTSCYGTYTVGFNIKREMALSPNDEVVASSKKTYPIQDYSAQTTPYFRPKLYVCMYVNLYLTTGNHQLSLS